MSLIICLETLKDLPWNTQISWIHNQYQIVSEGLETSQPNPDVVIKWFDSLIGYDAQSRIVPDPTLSDKEKYGSLNRPRQSWFKNKNEALKQSTIPSSKGIEEGSSEWEAWFLKFSFTTTY